MNKEDKQPSTTPIINLCQKQDLFSHSEVCRMKDSSERSTEDTIIVCRHLIAKPENYQMSER
jgi:hypothetical protein